MIRAAICACASLALAAPVPAAAIAAKPRTRTILHSSALWSTINVCSTALHPHTIGIRGSMPGSGVKHEQMFMRFRVQYRNAKGSWSYIGASGNSSFVAVGSATAKARQSGRSFQLTLLPGQKFLLRGVVSFQWRRGGRVVRRARKRTRAGHRTAAGSDPRGYSAAVCALT